MLLHAEGEGIYIKLNSVESHTELGTQIYHLLFSHGTCEEGMVFDHIIKMKKTKAFRR